MTYEISRSWTPEAWKAFKRKIPNIGDTPMRRAARVDANQAELVSYLRALGCSVAITNHVGNGFPDLVVGHSRLALAEVKDPRQPRHDREKNKDQQKFHAEWKGHVWTLQTTDDCDKLFEWISRSKA